MAIGSYTRAQIRAKIQAKLDASPFWTTVEVNDALNEAIYTYGLMTGLWKARTTVVTTAGDGRIYFDPSIMRPFRISRGGVPLMQATLVDIDNGRPGWQGETTATGGTVPTTVQAWVPLNWSIDTGTPQAKITTWPEDTVGGTTLTVDYYTRPPVLTNDTDLLDIDDADLEAVMAKALIVLSFKKPASLKAGFQVWQQEFTHMIGVRNGRLAASDQFKKVMGNGQDGQRALRVDERVES